MKFLHVYDNCYHTTINDSRVITVASDIVGTPNSPKIIVGVSVKHPGDVFNKKIGNIEAQRNLYKYNLPICFADYRSINVWSLLIAMYQVNRDKRYTDSLKEEIVTRLRAEAVANLRIYLSCSILSASIYLKMLGLTIYNGTRETMNIDVINTMAQIKQLNEYDGSLDFSSIESEL